MSNGITGFDADFKESVLQSQDGAQGVEAVETVAGGSFNATQTPEPGKVCPSCARDFPMTSNFCPHCGVQLVVKGIATSIPEAPVLEKPAYEEPTQAAPAFEVPMFEEPVQETPVFEAPIVEEPVQDAPAFEVPAEEPTQAAPAFEIPMFEEPVQETPVFEAPIVEEPAQEAPAFEAPVVEESIQAEPVFVAPAERIIAETAQTVSEASAPVKVCPSCAREFPMTSNFCPHCGVQLVVKEIELTVPEAPPFEEPAQETPAFEAPEAEEPIQAEPVIETPAEEFAAETAQTVSEASAPVKVCPSCARGFPPTSNFCPHCGVQLVVKEIKSTVPEAPVAEESVQPTPVFETPAAEEPVQPTPVFEATIAEETVQAAPAFETLKFNEPIPQEPTGDDYDNGGATTVLGGGMASVNTPNLVRKSNHEKIFIAKDSFVIGKNRNIVDYAIAGNNAISRCHAVINTIGSDYYVIDQNSTNHTFVNGKIIPARTSVQVFDGDEIIFANEIFVFHLN